MSQVFSVQVFCDVLNVRGLCSRNLFVFLCVRFDLLDTTVREVSVSRQMKHKHCRVDCHHVDCG